MPSADELTQTRNAQLATYVLSLVALDAVERLGVEPAIAAGHSLGEYSALTAAGALDFSDGVQLVAERGEAMQIAADERTGTMAAVLGLDDDKVEIACMRAAADVWAANFNAPGNVVIAGDPDAIASAGAIAKDLGASKVLPVKVSGAFHTPFMAPARDRLRKALSEVDFRSLDIPVVANVDAAAHDDRRRLARPAHRAAVQPGALAPDAPRAGRPGHRDLRRARARHRCLSGTVKRTLEGARALAVNTPDDLDTLLERIEGEAGAAHHEGEHLFMTERVVVSPAAGLFAPIADLDAGRPIEAGDLLGTVGEAEVRSPFSGRIEGVLAHLGERVMSRQPIAWLRTA